jgi:hypothetical protein
MTIDHKRIIKGSWPFLVMTVEETRQVQARARSRG